MKPFISWSIIFHIFFFICISVNMRSSFKQEELDTKPISVAIIQEPEKAKKKAAPLPKKMPTIKKTHPAPAPQTRIKKTPAPKKVTAPASKKSPPKKVASPPQKKGAPAKPLSKTPQNKKPASAPIKQKPQSGIKKEKQKFESMDAAFNTLLPGKGGKKTPSKSKTEKSSNEPIRMPLSLELQAIKEIKQQIEAVWNYNPTEGIKFTLYLRIDTDGKILQADLKEIAGLNASQRAAAEAAYRATLKLGKLVLNSAIFKPEFYKDSWSEIEIHFYPPVKEKR